MRPQNTLMRKRMKTEKRKKERKGKVTFEEELNSAVIPNWLHIGTQHLSTEG